MRQIAGFAVLGLLRGLVRTPALNTALSEGAKPWLPLVVALIFVARQNILENFALENKRHFLLL